MNRCLPILMLVCISICSSAQTTLFTAGYIVKQDGDTVQGYLQEEIRTKLLYQVKFKAGDLGAAVQTFTPADIMLFKYEPGNLYKAITFFNAVADASPSKTCFALQLVSGTYSLYSYLADDQTYFVTIGNGVSYQLYNAVYNTNGSLDKEGNFISRLELLSATCLSRALHADQIPYNEKEIAKFIFDLNNCISPNSASNNYYQKPKTITQFSAFVGGIVLGKNKNQFTADVALKLTYPQLSRNVSINIGAHFSHTTKENTAKEFGSTVLLNSPNDDIFSVPLTIQFNFTDGLIQPFIYAGFAVAYLNQNVTYSNYSTSTVEPPDKFGLSAIAALGLEAHVTTNLYIRAEWRYELLVQYPALGVNFLF
jgi:opacity protein-like surface antigen